jgi:oxygen-dependent protoporphyrinogen oxidase
MAETRVPVAIVGGGIAGLSAAFALAKRGVEFVLLEARSRWGGVIRTETADGFLVEAGPDALFAQKPEGLALCRELGLGERLVPTNPNERKVYIARRGRLHPLPDGLFLTIPTRILPFARARLFSWPAKLRMGLELFIPRRRETTDESIAAFMRRRFGREALELLGEPLLAGIHSGDPERLSMRATFPRFLELEARYGSLIRGFLAARSPRRSGPTPAAFYSLAGGLEELVHTLVARLPSEALRLNQAVVRIERAADGYALSCPSGDSVSARAVILAAPGYAAAPLLSDLAPEVAQALGAIPFVSTAVVFLGYRREDVKHPLDGYGLMVPRTEGMRTAAASFFSTKYLGRAPEGHVLLRGFVGGARDPDVLALKDDALVELVRAELGTLLGIAAPPGFVRVYRWPRGTPQTEVGHMQRVDELEQRLRATPGVFVTGAGWRTTGISDGVGDATRVAQAAAEFVARIP